MKELIIRAKGRLNQWKQSTDFWKKTALLFGLTYVFSYYIFMLALSIKGTLDDLKEFCANISTANGNLTSDCNIMTMYFHTNSSSSTNGTNDSERNYKNGSANPFPILILFMEYSNIFGELQPHVFSVVVNKNFVAFGQNPSKKARCFLIIILMYHFVNFLYTITFSRHIIPTLNFVGLVIIDIYGIISNIMVRYACTKFHFLVWEEDFEYRKRAKEEGREITESKATGRWNWHDKGTIFLSLFLTVMFCVFGRLMYANVFIYEKMEERISPTEQLWILPLASFVLFCIELGTIWRDKISLAECIIYKKLYVAFGPNRSMLAWNFMIINVLFHIFHSLTVIFSWNFEGMNNKNVNVLLTMNLFLIGIHVIIRHSFSTFYNLTSERKKKALIKKVKTRLRKTDEEDDASISLRDDSDSSSSSSSEE